MAAGGGGGWYYFNKGSDKKPEFQTVKVGRGDITQVVTATGDLQPVVVVDIGAQVSGQIKEVRVDFNSVVKAGDVLLLFGAVGAGKSAFRCVRVGVCAASPLGPGPHVCNGGEATERADGFLL